MLILSRKKDEVIVINDSITVRIVEVKGDTVRLGIEAPKDVKVYRKEIYDAIAGENQAARGSSSNLAALKSLLGSEKTRKSEK